MINSDYKRNDLGVIVNDNLDEFERFKQRRSQIVREKSLEGRVKMLEDEIKNLKELVGNLNGS